MFAWHVIANNSVHMRISVPTKPHSYEVERFFANTIPVQAVNLMKALDEFAPDISSGDALHFGTSPMPLGLESSRPRIAALAVSVRTREAAGVPQDDLRTND